MHHDLSDDGSDHRSRSDDEAKNSIDGNESANEDVQKDDDENEDGTGRRIDPATSRKRIIRNPIPKLDTARLRGPKGVHTIEKYFEGFKFHGKGHEKNDLNRIMKRLEHWAHRLFPKYQFDDFLEKVEVLGPKRDVQTFLTKYRQDMLSDDIIMAEADGEMAVECEPASEPVDEFDLLIAEQIEKNKQVTMSQSSRVNAIDSNFSVVSTPNQIPTHNKQSSTTATDVSSNGEIKKRIERNRQLAIERRLARLKRDEQMTKNRLEQPTTFDEMAQTPNASKFDNNSSIVESDTIVNEKILDSIDEGSNDCVAIEDSRMDSNENSMMDNSGSASTYEAVSNKKVPSKPLLTEEQLDKTIDDAVNKFLQQKCQSKQHDL